MRVWRGYGATRRLDTCGFAALRALWLRVRNKSVRGKFCFFTQCGLSFFDACVIYMLSHRYGSVAQLVRAGDS